MKFVQANKKKETVSTRDQYNIRMVIKNHESTAVGNSSSDLKRESIGEMARYRDNSEISSNDSNKMENFDKVIKTDESIELHKL